MNTRTDREPLFHALLDGTLDPEGEARVIELLEIDAGARREFADLVELHMLLSSRAGAPGNVATSLAQPNGGRKIRKMAGLSLYWLSAAAAVAVASNAAISAPAGSGGMDFTRDVAPVLEAHCGRCHADTAALAAGKDEILWNRVNSPGPCASSLDEGARSVLRRWLMIGLVRF